MPNDYIFQISSCNSCERKQTPYGHFLDEVRNNKTKIVQIQCLGENVHRFAEISRHPISEELKFHVSGPDSTATSSANLSITQLHEIGTKCQLLLIQQSNIYRILINMCRHQCACQAAQLAGQHLFNLRNDV